VRWIRDRTGRLALRPHFEPGEIDRECEALLRSGLSRHRGAPVYPVTTDDLTVLVEAAADDLDLFADLSAYGPDAEGVTDFFPGRRPRVRIAGALSDSLRREHRLRTTLAHELGHVHLHACLWTLDAPAGAGRAAGSGPRCRRPGIERPPESDWLEWQAGYAGGALLMPAGAVSGIVAALLAPAGLSGPLHAAGTMAGTLVRRVARSFDVSQPAAEMRLLKLGYLHRAGSARHAGPARVA
jgi:hypothetical protein